MYCVFFPELQQRLGNEHLSFVCNNIGSRWKELATSLGFSRGITEAIEADYRHEGTYEMAYQTILKWKQQRGCQATVGELVQVLQHAGLTDLAVELQNR